MTLDLICKLVQQSMIIATPPVLNIAIFTLNSDTGKSKSILSAHLLDVFRIHSGHSVGHGKATQKNEGHNGKGVHGDFFWRRRELISIEFKCFDSRSFELLMTFSMTEGGIYTKFDVWFVAFSVNAIYFHFSWKLYFLQFMSCTNII